MEKKPSGYYLIEDNVVEVLKQCKTIREFVHTAAGTQYKQHKDSWPKAKALYESMRKYNSANTWTNYENCYNVAKLCTSRGEFSKKYGQAYYQSINNKTTDGIKWIDSFNWLSEPYQNRTDLCKEKLNEEIKKYRYLSDVPHNLKALLYYYYNTEEMHNLFSWLYDKKTYNENKKKYIIYLYVFSNLDVYVGLTCDIKTRCSRHKKDIKDNVLKHSKKTGMDVPTPRIIAKDISAFDASKNEKLWVNYLKESGYNVINKAPAGSLGGCGTKYTREEILNTAKKYNRLVDFRKDYPSMCAIASRHKIKLDWLEKKTHKKTPA